MESTKARDLSECHGFIFDISAEPGLVLCEVCEHWREGAAPGVPSWCELVEQPLMARVVDEYISLIEFLEEQDELNEPDDYLVYEKAVEKYELLHKILQIEDKPKWCS